MAPAPGLSGPSVTLPLTVPEPELITISIGSGVRELTSNPESNTLCALRRTSATYRLRRQPGECAQSKTAFIHSGNQKASILAHSIHLGHRRLSQRPLQRRESVLIANSEDLNVYIRKRLAGDIVDPPSDNGSLHHFQRGFVIFARFHDDISGSGWRINSVDCLPKVSVALSPDGVLARASIVENETPIAVRNHCGPGAASGSVISSKPP